MNGDFKGYGLATVKAEGGVSSFDHLVEFNGELDKSETRWIEMCYDPAEDMSHIDLDPFREAFQTQQLCNNYTDDDMYLIIKSLANEFINDKGF